tara:strand:- start:297 stop:578 length:282 start_codon:yes stop_codon:yes gene_type:complete
MTTKRKKYIMKKKKINFVSARDGKIELHFNDDNNSMDCTVKSSANPIILADIMSKYGFDDVVMASSSMDYAKESGFKTDDGAKKLYNNALNLI